MPEVEDVVCWECVTDAVLRQWIRDNGQAGTCAFCGRRRVACSFPKLARKIDEAIREFYRPAQETAHVVKESDNLKYWADGTPADEIIQEIAGVEPDLADALDAFLHRMEQHDVRDGGDTYYDGTPLEHIDAYPDQFMEIWRCFEERLKHGVRFFDEEGKRRLDDLFGGLPSMAGGKTIVTIEPAGEFSAIFRARIIEGSNLELFLKEPARQIGPPPPLLARAGRMNPVGIPVFYGAFSQEVAVAEIRPPVGASVAVGQFKLLRTVRLLDLPALSSVYHSGSIFSPEYDRLRNHVAFLGRVDQLLARPVLPSDEALEYLPTQAVAAYIASVMGLDGVIYRSTQIGADRDPFKQVDRKLCNVVLFGGAARVENTQAESKVSDDSVPTMFVPGLRPGAESAEAMDPSARPVGNGVLISEEAIAESREEAATLRVDPQPRLVRVRSVAVETSSMHAHLLEDGSVFINDFENEYE